MTYGCSIKVWLTDHLGTKRSKKHDVKKGLIELEKEYDEIDNVSEDIE